MQCNYLSFSIIIGSGCFGLVRVSDFRSAALHKDGGHVKYFRCYQKKSQSLTFLPGWRPGVHRFHVLVVCPVEERHVQSWHHLPLSLSPSSPLRKEHITWSGRGGGTNFTLTLTFPHQYLRSGSGGSLNISSHLQLLPACCVRSA